LLSDGFPIACPNRKSPFETGPETRRHLDDKTIRRAFEDADEFGSKVSFWRGRGARKGPVAEDSRTARQSTQGSLYPHESIFNIGE